MDVATDRGLQLRMVASVLLPAGCLCWLVVTILSMLVLPWWIAPFLAIPVTLIGVLVVAALEYRQVASIERRADATPVTAEAYPDLHERTRRIATQLDVPMPTVAVSERTTPEALVAGFRPSAVHFVVSEGTLDALDDGELDAVIAHELAHVANRDAMVMTVVSAPAIVADGLRSRVGGLGLVGAIVPGSTTPGRPGDETDDELDPFDPEYTVHGRTSDDDDDDDTFLPVVVIGLLWVVSRATVAVLSRTREIAADRTAAAVTGSPASLASALQTLDGELDDAPRADLREAADISSLSILPTDPIRTEPLMLGPEGSVMPAFWSIREPLRRFQKRVFSTHPATESRLERLAELERENE